jgi:hypothetical protein
VVSQIRTKPYRVQRYYPTLQIGKMLTAHCQRKVPVELHLRQSSMDSACGHHCLAMALIAMGLVKRSAVIDQARRRYGVAANLYAVLADHWMEGVYALEMVSAIDQLNLPLDVTWADGFNSGVDALAVEALTRGSLVLLAYQSERNRHRHWVTAIGCGGLMDQKTFTVDTLLVLDPSMESLPLAIGNGQLVTPRSIDFKHRRTSVKWNYESAEGTEPVRLMSAVGLTLRSVLPQKRKH